MTPEEINARLDALDAEWRQIEDELDAMERVRKACDGPLLELHQEFAYWAESPLADCIGEIMSAYYARVGDLLKRRSQIHAEFDRLHKEPGYTEAMRMAMAAQGVI